MSDIPIAYPIIDQSSDISDSNIIYDDYKFRIIYQQDNYIEITIIDKSYQIYQQTITKSKLSFSKLYKLIINSLNKELNYSINIEHNDKINLTIQYNNEMIDIIEEIQLIKQSDTKSTELLLVNKIKELEERIIYLETKQALPYGYDFNATTLTIIPTNNNIYNCSYFLDDIQINSIEELYYSYFIKKFKKLDKIIFKSWNDKHLKNSNIYNYVKHKSFLQNKDIYIYNLDKDLLGLNHVISYSYKSLHIMGIYPEYITLINNPQQHFNKMSYKEVANQNGYTITFDDM
jgi:hypothetical protein